MQTDSPPITRGTRRETRTAGSGAISPKKERSSPLPILVLRSLSRGEVPPGSGRVAAVALAEVGLSFPVGVSDMRPRAIASSLAVRTGPRQQMAPAGGYQAHSVDTGR
jgi:hypothetical protein